MRFINLLALALMAIVLAGTLLATSKVASADQFGTDCVIVYATKIAGVNCRVPEEGPITRKVATGTNSCATSPSGLCCTYDDYKLYCVVGNILSGYSHELTKAGEAGKSCVNGECVTP